MAPSSNIKHVKAVYRQRIYYYVVQFSGMLHSRLQRYHTRIRTLRSSLLLLLSSNVSLAPFLIQVSLCNAETFYISKKSFIEDEFQNAFHKIKIYMIFILYSLPLSDDSTIFQASQSLSSWVELVLSNK